MFLRRALVRQLAAKSKAKSTKKTAAVAATSEGVESGSLPQVQKDALNMALSRISKQFGAGAIRQLGASDLGQEVKVISTGILTVDDAIGVGGLPRGRIIEVFGPEASGKTCT